MPLPMILSKLPLSSCKAPPWDCVNCNVNWKEKDSLMNIKIFASSHLSNCNYWVFSVVHMNPLAIISNSFNALTVLHFYEGLMAVWNNLWTSDIHCGLDNWVSDLTWPNSIIMFILTTPQKTTYRKKRVLASYKNKDCKCSLLVLAH